MSARRLWRFLRLTEYGGDELLIAGLACGATACALGVLGNRWLAGLPVIPLAIVLWFFRDPERRSAAPADELLAPADGTVSDIEEVDEPTFIGGRALRIGIFLSPLNVHVNRAPCAGVVCFRDYKAGEFLPAYNPEAPTRNESVALGLRTADGVPILVKQITGVLARRIVCAASVGDAVERGQRYGMIKFGSRTELYVPVSVQPRPLVALRGKVAGGVTAVCEIPAVAPVAPRN
jgi:phosphatidylserine decarboxylase